MSPDAVTPGTVTPGSGVAPGGVTAAERRLINRAALRILPFMMVCYLVSYIDRVNIGFATFGMDQAVHLTPETFGLGGALYFVTYVIFEVPSNMLIGRMGVRLFLTRIMVSWGIVSCAMALVQGTWSFLGLRLLLGAAEAGLFPGVILYLTFWFPRAYRASFIGWFALAIPLSSVVGSPISAALLRMDQVLGFAGWQWLFVIEGLPAVILGVACFLTIADGPAEARWLTAGERATYAAMMAREEPAPAGAAEHVPVWRILVNPTVLGLAVVLAASSAISNTYAVWSPRFIGSFGMSGTNLGWLNALPYLLGAAALILTAYSSDRRRERIWHAAVPLYAAAVAIVLMSTGQFLFAYAMLACSIMGIYAGKSPTWAVATEWLPPSMKAVGIAQVNAVSSLISFFPIYIVGAIRSAGGSFGLAFLPMALISAAGASILLYMSWQRSRATAADVGLRRAA